MTTEFVAEAITFVAMLAIIIGFLWPKIMTKAEAQQDRISAALDEAEKTRVEVAAALLQSQQQLDEARSRADAIIAQAKKAAAEETDDIRRTAERDIESFLAQATTQIAAERDRAIQELRRETGRLVVATAGRALSQALTDKGHSTLIKESVAKLAPRGADRN